MKFPTIILLLIAAGLLALCSCGSPTGESEAPKVANMENPAQLARDIVAAIVDCPRPHLILAEFPDESLEVAELPPWGSMYEEARSMANNPEERRAIITEQINGLIQFLMARGAVKIYLTHYPPGGPGSA